MKLVKTLVVGVMMLALQACSIDTVPPAHKGKILSGSGYSENVLESGKYYPWWWESIVLLDTSTQIFSERINVKSQDQLDVPFTVNFRTRISGSDKVINGMFNDIKHENYMISLTQVYNVYGRNVVTNASRSVMGKYKATEIAVNFDKINSEIQKEVTSRMDNSPLEVSDVTLADVAYPTLITEAVEKQHERELAIKTEQNEQAIRMVKKENEMKLAEADYEIRMVNAKAIRDENKITAEGLNPTLLQYRNLEVLEKMAASDNKVFIPYSAMKEVGVSNTMYK